MKSYLNVLNNCSLFRNINVENLDTLVHCFGYTIQHFNKNAIIMAPGDYSNACQIVLSGVVQIYKTDFKGNRHILFKIGEGDAFGETTACTNSPSTLYAVAETECKILNFDLQKISTPCSLECEIHRQIILNLLEILAKNSTQFYGKMTILAQKTARDRILDFLNLQADYANSNKFDIPYSREELADYLCMNRGTLSRELSQMRDQGLIQFQRKSFELMYDPEDEGSYR